MSKENYQLKTCPPFIVKYALILAPKTAYFYYSFILTDFLTYIPAREGSLILQWTLSVGHLGRTLYEIILVAYLKIRVQIRVWPNLAKKVIVASFTIPLPLPLLLLSHAR